MTQNRPVRTPVALAVLNLLAEREMHPYEMRRVMSERGHEWIIKFRGGLVYHTIQRLHEAGMLKSNPQKLIARATDWRFLNELKKELKA